MHEFPLDHLTRGIATMRTAAEKVLAEGDTPGNRAWSEAVLSVAESIEVWMGFDYGACPEEFVATLREWALATLLEAWAAPRQPVLEGQCNGAWQALFFVAAMFGMNAETAGLDLPIDIALAEVERQGAVLN